MTLNNASPGLRAALKTFPADAAGRTWAIGTGPDGSPYEACLRRDGSVTIERKERVGVSPALLTTEPSGVEWQATPRRVTNL
jgi:hypothetical protein